MGKIKKYLLGKTIKDIKWYIYDTLKDPCIDEIIFTDGTVISLWGRADNCVISSIKMPDGTFIDDNELIEEIRKEESMKVRCICEPKGANGLEGFMLDEEYYAKYILEGNFYRVYHNPDYYETCGPNIFRKYFTIVEKNRYKL